MSFWIDTHTHFKMLEITNVEAIAQAQAQNVQAFINIGTCMDDLKEVLELAQAYEFMGCTLGVHPHDAEAFGDARDFILDHAKDSSVVALGEMGLDYYYEHSDRETQKKVFEEQLQMSIDFGLPVEIHTRDAEEDTLDILRSFSGKVKGLIHCFTGTQRLADEVLKLGMNISISGVVTFKKAEALRDVVKSLPLDRIHIETDAPFLTPTPHRGRKNQPAYVIHTAEYIGQLLGLELDELQAQLLMNSKKMFPRFKFIQNA